MFCGKCGAPNPDTARFCSTCGQILVTAAAQQNEPEKNQSHQLPVGAMLRNRYRVGKALGQGGFGITYLGYDTLMETQVAIKEFYPGTIVGRNTAQTLAVNCHTQQYARHFYASRERFLREAKALVKFKNIPEVVDILDFVEENNTAYIIMEYVQGMSLVKYVAARGGKLTPEETFRILKPVMEALAEVHSGGIVHRDIAPDNIILHPTGGAKLLDFGAVRTVESDDAEAPLAKSTEAILKHGFAPIEQYNSRGSLGPWTDAYAMCATVFYCLTGTIPPEASLRISEGVDPDWKHIPGLTGTQISALEKGMALRAKDRYPDMAGLLQALFAPAAVPTPQPKPASNPQPKPASNPQPKPAPKPQPKPEQNKAQTQPKPVQKPAPKPQPKPEPKKSNGFFGKFAVMVALLVGGLFSGVAIYTTLFPSGGQVTTLADDVELFPVELASITLYDGTDTTRSSETESEYEILELWAHISGREIRETEPESINSFWQKTHDESNISLYIWGGEFGKHISIYVTPEGDMYFHSSADNATRYYTDCAEIYEALETFLPEGDNTLVGNCIPDMNWTFLQIDIINPDGTLLDGIATDNAEMIDAVVGELRQLTVQYGGGLYADFGGYIVQLRLAAEDGGDYYITVYDDGSTNLEMGDWNYGIYGALDVYDAIYKAVEYIRLYS